MAISSIKERHEVNLEAPIGAINTRSRPSTIRTRSLNEDPLYYISIELLHDGFRIQRRKLFVGVTCLL